MQEISKIVRCPVCFIKHWEEHGHTCGKWKNKFSAHHHEWKMDRSTEDEFDSEWVETAEIKYLGGCR